MRTAGSCAPRGTPADSTELSPICALFSRLIGVTHASALGAVLAACITSTPTIGKSCKLLEEGQASMGYGQRCRVVSRADFFLNDSVQENISFIFIALALVLWGVLIIFAVI